MLMLQTGPHFIAGGKGLFPEAPSDWILEAMMDKVHISFHLYSLRVSNISVLHHMTAVF